MKVDKKVPAKVKVLEPQNNEFPTVVLAEFCPVVSVIL